MQIDKNTLPSLAEYKKLETLFEKHARAVTRPALLTPKYSFARLRVARELDNPVLPAREVAVNGDDKLVQRLGRQGLLKPL